MGSATEKKEWSKVDRRYVEASPRSEQDENLDLGLNPYQNHLQGGLERRERRNSIVKRVGIYHLEQGTRSLPLPKSGKMKRDAALYTDSV